MEGKAYKIEEILKEKGIYVGPTAGYSMYPMLKDRRDTVIIRPKTDRLKRLDVALYLSEGRYVLHRVLEVVEDGYIIRGDNCYADEHVKEEAVFGVLTEFYRKNKHFLCTDKKYLQYAEKRLRTYSQRKKRMIIKLKRRKFIKSLFGLDRIKKNKKS